MMKKSTIVASWFCKFPKRKLLILSIKNGFYRLQTFKYENDFSCRSSWFIYWGIVHIIVYSTVVCLKNTGSPWLRIASCKFPYLKITKALFSYFNRKALCSHPASMLYFGNLAAFAIASTHKSGLTIIRKLIIYSLILPPKFYSTNL